MDDALPPDLQIGDIIPRFDPTKRTMMASERQTEETLGAVPASPSDSVPQMGGRFFSTAAASAGQTDWAALETSKFLVGSDPDGWSVVLLEPNPNAALENRGGTFVPVVLLGHATSSDVATGFHLSAGGPTDSGLVETGTSGTSGGVGVEPPQLGDGISPSPEPGGLVLFGLAAGPIFLKRRRNAPSHNTRPHCMKTAALPFATMPRRRSRRRGSWTRDRFNFTSPANHSQVNLTSRALASIANFLIDTHSRGWLTSVLIFLSRLWGVAVSSAMNAGHGMLRFAANLIEGGTNESQKSQGHCASSEVR